MSDDETTVKVRNSLLDAALSFVESAAELAGVQRIALIGSLLTDRPARKMSISSSSSATMRILPHWR